MTMETLNTNILTNFQLQDLLIRIADIVNFEGPLLTLFQQINNKHLYLFDWVDKNQEFNRWLIYRCNPKMLNRFISGQISHYDLFISDEPFCFKIDIDKNLTWHSPQQIEKKKLPQSYLPVKDDYFDKSDCPNFKKLNQFVNQTNESQKQENLFVSSHLFNQENERIVKRYTQKKYDLPKQIIISNQIKPTRLKIKLVEYPIKISNNSSISNKSIIYKQKYVSANH